jgi:hypothetical protein
MRGFHEQVTDHGVGSNGDFDDGVLLPASLR